MTDLYELTRTFVRRGCPLPPGVELRQRNVLLRSTNSAGELLPSEQWEWAQEEYWGFGPLAPRDDEYWWRAFWTLWVLEWLRDMTAEKDVHVEHHDSTGWQVSSCFDMEWVGPDGKLGKFDFHVDHSGPTILEAIEAATRHLEPTNEH